MRADIRRRKILRDELKCKKTKWKSSKNVHIICAWRRKDFFTSYDLFFNKITIFAGRKRKFSFSSRRTSPCIHLSNNDRFKKVAKTFFAIFSQQIREKQRLYYLEWALKTVSRSKASRSLYQFAESDISLYVRAAIGFFKSYRFQLFHRCQC